MVAVKKIVESLILFIIGGAVYYLIEILWRGYSHWTMFILGGIAFLLVGHINVYFAWGLPLWKQCGIAAVIVTVLEFIVGLIIVKGFKIPVWDYSDVPLNFMGIISLPYTIIWYFLSLVGIVLDDVVRWILFKEERPRYKII